MMTYCTHTKRKCGKSGKWSADDVQVLLFTTKTLTINQQAILLDRTYQAVHLKLDAIRCKNKGIKTRHQLRREERRNMLRSTDSPSVCSDSVIATY